MLKSKELVKHMNQLMQYSSPLRKTHDAITIIAMEETSFYESSVIHTISICCSPLISMASTLSSEQGMEGKVISNCMYTHKVSKHLLTAHILHIENLQNKHHIRALRFDIYEPHSISKSGVLI